MFAYYLRLAMISLKRNRVLRQSSAPRNADPSERGVLVKRLAKSMAANGAAAK